MFKHTANAGEDKTCSATIASHPEETKEVHCVSQRWPRRTVLGWPLTKKQFRVLSCRSEEGHVRTRERKELFHWVLCSGDEN